MWFKRPGVSRQLFYPLRLTLRRNNVQILLSQLQWRAKEGDFFCVIYDREGAAFFVPYSWLQVRVLCREPRIRERPKNPSQQYYTVYPVQNSSTRFSFGPGRDGETIEDLAQFRNAVRNERHARVILEGTHLRNWDDRYSAAVSFRKGEIPDSITQQLAAAGGPGHNVGLAGHGGAVFVTERGDVIAVRKERGLSPSVVVKMYEQMIRDGKVSGDLSKTTAKSRPFQAALRLVALDIYGHRCAMCDVDVPSQLVTSHIVAVSRSEGILRARPSNTILLCRLHDGLFGEGLISITPDYRIVCSPKLVSKSKLLRRWALKLDGTQLSIPSRHRPERALLRDHLKRAGLRGKYSGK